jgi:hypothetical protein
MVLHSAPNKSDESLSIPEPEPIAPSSGRLSSRAGHHACMANDRAVIHRVTQLAELQREVPLRNWLGDVRSTPRHAAFMMGGSGDPAIVELCDGTTVSGSLSFCPDAVGFRLVLEADERGGYCRVDESERSKSTTLLYEQVASVRCGRFRWPQPDRA